MNEETDAIKKAMFSRAVEANRLFAAAPAGGD
jgi:hypothetical protein